MPDPQATAGAREFEGLSAADRESRIEQLLLTGLDHYFAAEYDRAISTWTRVLFLDRGHARAKAYIDRARGAIGERQRESDELLHRGVDAFNHGDTDTARRLLSTVVERGGPQEVALSLLERLSRLEQQPARSLPRTDARVRPPRLRLEPLPRDRRRRAWALPVAILGILVLVLFYIQGSRERTAPFQFLWGGGSAASSVRVAAEPLVVPRAAEIDLERARMLAAQGYSRDALRLLERIGPGDPLREEAAQLKGEIQQALLSKHEGGAVTPPRTAEAPGTGAGRDQ
jgi:hypothetical protein